MRRRDLLLGAAGGAALLAPWRSLGEPPARKLVMVVAHGGWDLTYAFDPKPGVDGIAGPYPDLDPDDPLDVEELGSWGAYDVTLNARRRPLVTGFFERWGAHTAVVRGIWVGAVSHWIGLRRILTGTDDARAADVASLLGASRGGHLPLAAVDLSNLGRFGEHSRMVARGGVRGQLGQLLDPTLRLPLPDGSGRHTLGVTADERSAIEAWLQGEHERSERPARRRALDDRLEARARAARLEARAPELALPPTGPLSGRELARLTTSLLASGTTDAVLVDSGQTWDTHVGHALQHNKLDRMFGGLDTLLTELQTAGLLEHTVVAVVSEMMRTPFRVADGDGTDHWPWGGMMLVGAGIAGGSACGATDDHLLGVPVDVESGVPHGGGEILRYDHVIAGLMEHVGLDHPRWSGIPRLRGFAV